ncbi:hypothetical protein F5J12DRAFT_905079 [Pisolithus orientalis]|uniref:uncharacterized protein n=1 Tax=Pisolithus orientalis TaxID=936130 RepID=UPI002224B416|nr:uncharacterized protein F5J12DRAFT_905079 [Pisolithus orientalis]KAI6009555.1 hypothetical protein F5J12DRAFT_905079 [Pisolithus orientalis]
MKKQTRAAREQVAAGPSRGALYVPTPASVLDGCGDSFHAADEKRQKASTQFFADTGLMALLCHHDHVLWLVNMTLTRENQHYALVLVKHLFDHLPAKMTVGLLYDISCQLEHSCQKWKLLDDGILSRLKFGISVFHVLSHTKGVW